MPTKRRHHILTIPAGDQQRRDKDLAQHGRLFTLRSALGLAEAHGGGAAGDAAVRVRHQDHIVLLHVEDGEEHALEDVVGIVLRGDVLAAACRMLSVDVPYRSRSLFIPVEGSSADSVG
jgi:hypothetical protein